MKFYIKATSEKPVLDSVYTEWEEFEDGTGIKFTIYSEDNDVLFEEVFNYDDVDSDAIFDSAVDMALLVLSQQYEISESARAAIMEE